MNFLTMPITVPIALGLLTLLGIMIVFRTAQVPPGRCLMCGRRVEKGEWYCKYHDSDL